MESLVHTGSLSKGLLGDQLFQTAAERDLRPVLAVRAVVHQQEV